MSAALDVLFFLGPQACLDDYDCYIYFPGPGIYEHNIVADLPRLLGSCSRRSWMSAYRE